MPDLIVENEEYHPAFKVMDTAMLKMFSHRAKVELHSSHHLAREVWDHLDPNGKHIIKRQRPIPNTGMVRVVVMCKLDGQTEADHHLLDMLEWDFSTLPELDPVPKVQHIVVTQPINTFVGYPTEDELD